MKSKLFDEIYNLDYEYTTHAGNGKTYDECVQDIVDTLYTAVLGIIGDDDNYWSPTEANENHNEMIDNRNAVRNLIRQKWAEFCGKGKDEKEHN